MSKGSVVRLIRINKLIDELKALVDSGELSIRAGVEGLLHFERSDAHGHFQRTVPVEGQAEGQLRQPVLQLLLRTDTRRQACQRPHGYADHRSLRLRESAVGGDRTIAASRLPVHR